MQNERLFHQGKQIWSMTFCDSVEVRKCYKICGQGQKNSPTSVQDAENHFTRRFQVKNNCRHRCRTQASSNNDNAFAPIVINIKKFRLYLLKPQTECSYRGGFEKYIRRGIMVCVMGCHRGLDLWF